jgi:hypothetical protein
MISRDRWVVMASVRKRELGAGPVDLIEGVRRHGGGGIASPLRASDS